MRGIEVRLCNRAIVVLEKLQIAAVVPPGEFELRAGLPDLGFGLGYARLRFDRLASADAWAACAFA